MSGIAVGALLGIGITLLFYLLIAKSDYRHAQDLRQYFFYDWSLGKRDIAATVFASGMSLATVIIALLQLGRSFGIALCWATLTYCIGWSVLARLAPLIRRRTRRTETLHTFIGRAFASSSVRTVAAGATTVGFVGTFATELIAGGIIFEALGFSENSATWGIVLFALVTIGYSSSGGFRSVIRSDRVQAALLLPAVFGVVILGVLCWMQSGSPRLQVAPLGVFLPLTVAIGITLLNVTFPIVDMSAWQRVRSASSNEGFRKGSIYAVAGFALTWTVLILLSILVAPAIPEDADPFVTIVQRVTGVPKAVGFIIGMLVFPGLIAAMLSTADTFLNAAGHTFSIDLRKVTIEDTQIRGRAHVRVHVLLLGIVGFGMALFLREIGFGIVEMVFAVYGGTLALFTPVVAALFVPRRLVRHLAAPALVAICCGFAAAWLNGFYSVLGQGQTGGLWTFLARFLPMDVFRTPTYAFFSSLVVFIVLGVPVLLRSYAKGGLSR